jgi:hypothetical protein
MDAPADRRPVAVHSRWRFLPTTAAISQLPWQDKVDPWVIETAQSEGQVEFLVYLAEQADLSQAAQLTTKEAKGAYVYEQLTATAERTQGPLLAELRRLGLEHRAYWVANLVWVRGDLGAVQRLAARPDVAHLYANPRVQLELPESSNPCQSYCRRRPSSGTSCTSTPMMCGRWATPGRAWWSAGRIPATSGTTRR